MQDATQNERTAGEVVELMIDGQQWRIEFERLFGTINLKQISLDVARSIHQRLMEDEDSRELADTLHGKQLGHPLHPMLTDVTIGSWTFAYLFDILALLPGTRDIRKAGDKLTALGIISAVPTALTGITDYSAIKQDAASYGAAHGLLNGAAFFFYVRSALARLAGNRSQGLFYATLGMLCITASSWLGGELVYRHRVGVNHTPRLTLDEWTVVLPLEDLEENTPTRAEVDDIPLLLFRQGDAVYAINAVCSHAGGPLDEGQVVNGVCIECPWHQSVFDMRNGHLVHSPATYSQPHYAVRIQDGMIEVRDPAIPAEPA